MVLLQNIISYTPGSYTVLWVSGIEEWRERKRERKKEQCKEKRKKDKDRMRNEKKKKTT